MFTLKSSLNVLEDIQRRALRFVLCDYDSCYENLLTAASVSGIRINLLRSLAIEVLKCVNGLNPDYLNKIIHGDTSILSKPKVNYTHYGLKNFSSYGDKMWNTFAWFIEIGSISLWIQTNDKIMGWSQLPLFHLYPIHMKLRKIYGPTMAFTWLWDFLAWWWVFMNVFFFSWIRFPFMYICILF